MEEDLEYKINKKFIRNVIKPMKQQQMYSSTTDSLPYQIPSASELFGFPTSSPSPSPPPPSQQPPTSSPSPYETPVPFQPHQYTETRPLAPGRTSLYRNFEDYDPPTPRPTSPPPPPVLNCVSICGHVQSCPVCSQLYRPYTGIYATIIVILIIVILFLLKKIFQF
jgi:hypothetical protein